MKKIFVAILTALAVCSCDKTEVKPPSAITVPEGQQLSQTVYADRSTGTSAVHFTTNGPWNSTIKSGLAVRSGEEVESALDWISIYPSSGDKAGDYTIQISLAANLSGAKRLASITLLCGGEEVVVRLTQEALTASGKLPQEEETGSGIFTFSANQRAVNVVGATHSIRSSNLVQIAFRTAGSSTVKSEEFLLDLGNPLSSGRLMAGTYTASDRNQTPGNGAFVWYKSTLGGYSSGGTIVVSQSGNNYKFVLNVQTEDGQTVTGEFTGRLLYLNTEIKVSEVRLDQSHVELEVNRSITLNATVVPANALNKKLKWESFDPTVATVDQSGRVQTLKKGVTNITATAEDGGLKASCTVVVSDVSTTGNGSFTHTGTQQEIKLLKAVHTVSGYRNVLLDFYSSANKADFQLSFFNTLSNGRLPAGNYTYATGSGQNNGTFYISGSVLGGNPISGTAIVVLSGGQYTVALDVQLETDKTGVGGKITGNYTGMFEYPSPFVSVASIGLNKTTLQLERGNSETLVATILPANASHKVVKWSSSDSNVASVGSTGSVYASSVGTATITALTEEGNQTASCVVTVKAPEQTGSGTFTYTLGGKVVETFTAVRVVEDSFSNTLRFYDVNQQEGAYFNYQTSSGTLEAGTYQWDRVEAAPLRWYSQKGMFGKTIYYCEGVSNPGTIAVSKSGGSYTITLNWNVMMEGSSGTIVGSYSGTIK